MVPLCLSSSHFLVCGYLQHEFKPGKGSSVKLSSLPKTAVLRILIYFASFGQKGFLVDTKNTTTKDWKFGFKSMVLGGWMGGRKCRFKDGWPQSTIKKAIFFQNNQYKGFYQLHIRYIRLPLQRDFLGKYQHAIFQFSF